ncbi:MAG: BspA family leucine-rich repeat surface protein, partial [Flavicella sp.]|nr:BspA family leucine-rich repeat surface protein [Flavicella sp.]
MKVLYTVLFFVFFTSLIQAQQDAFITKWETSPDANGDPYVTIPTHPNETYDYDVNWGDGNSSTNQNGNATHVYASSGEKTVTITKTFPRIYLNNKSEAGKITSIEQWGTGIWTSMEKAFFGAEKLVMAATDNPVLSQVTSMKQMFRKALIFNGDISKWDTSLVTDMSGMFLAAEDFNQDIGEWNTSKVTDMASMFQGASIFNKNIGNWITSNVTSMSSAFRGASDFNQDIGSWDVTSLTNAFNMFLNATLSNDNYDALLAGWAAQTLHKDVNFHGGNSEYCDTDEHHVVLTQT